MIQFHLKLLLTCTLSCIFNPQDILPLLFRQAFRKMYRRNKCTNVTRIPNPHIYHEKYESWLKVQTFICCSLLQFFNTFPNFISIYFRGWQRDHSLNHTAILCPWQNFSPSTLPSNKETTPTTKLLFSSNLPFCNSESL